MITLAPFSTNLVAMALPIPVPLPVINAVLPWNFKLKNYKTFAYLFGLISGFFFLISLFVGMI
jgi:hypothetical protein